MILKEITCEEFNQFRNNFNIKSLYQSCEYSNVMRNQKYDSLFVGLFDNENIVAATMILTERNNKIKYGYVPKGFLIDYNNINLLKTFTNELKRFLSKKNVIAIKVAPPIIKSTYDLKYNVTTYNNYYDNIFYNLTSLGYKHLGYNNFFEALKPRYEAIIDLSSPYYILFKNIKKNFRTKIRSAEKIGVKVYKGNLDDLKYLYLQTKNKYPRDLEYFKNVYEEFQKSNKVEFFYSKLNTEKYLKYYQKKYLEQEENCSKINLKISNGNHELIDDKLKADKLFDYYRKKMVKATKLLSKYPDGIITSSILIINDNKEAYVLMDGYDNKYKNLNSKHLLIWKLCERYSKLGFKNFNLGGITNINIKDNPYKGLNEFKLSFNSIAVEYIGDFELICNNTLHFVYSSIPIKNILKR